MIAEISEGRIRVDCTPREGPLVKMAPGARWNAQERYWSTPLTWSACLALRGILGTALELGPELNAWGVTKVAEETKLVAIQQAEDVPGEEREYPDQRVGTLWLQQVRWGVLADEMGKGKTVQASVALRDAPGPILVICPSSVKTVWERHIAEWAPELSVAVVRGTAAQRLKAVESGADVVVINWEALRSFSRLANFAGIRMVKCPACGGTDESITEKKCQAHHRPLNHRHWGTVISDEIHRAADPKSQQTRAFWAVNEGAQVRWGLTGTPITDTPADMWAPLHGLAPLEFPSLTKFKDRYCDQGFNPYSGFMEIRGLREDTREEFHRILDPHMLRRLRGDEMPPVVNMRRECELGAQTKQGKAYAQMAKGLVANIEGGQAIGWNPLTQTQRLLQFAAAYAEVDEEGEIRMSEPSCKLDVLDEVYEEMGYRPCVVFAPSSQLIQLAEARLAKKNIPFGSVRGGISEADRQHSIDEFQAGHLPVMFLTAAGSEGITLTRSDTFIYLQRPWSLVHDLQAFSRVLRHGQEADRVLCMDLVVPGTIEERVFEVTEGKAERLEEVVRDADRLRDLLG